ncbi:hypothetical protein MMC15_003438 [Xylographa vitiligo]|nr:hypothetical protein [Xylographa vitiligo]
MAQPVSTATSTPIKFDEIVAELARIDAKLEKIRQVVGDHHGGSQQVSKLPQMSSKDVTKISTAEQNSSQDNLANASPGGDAISSGKEGTCPETDRISACSDRVSPKEVAQAAKTYPRGRFIAWFQRFRMWWARQFDRGSDLEMQERKTQEPETQELETQKLESQPPLLRLPFDIRIMIYRMVLLSARPFENPHMLLLDNFDGTVLPPEDINSSFIKTCRLVYREASPILYQNKFTFDSSLGVRLFKEERLKRITDLGLVIGRETPSYDRLPGLAREAKSWCANYIGVFQTKDKLDTVQKETTASWFESLKVLEVDFSQWKLKKEEPFSPLLLKGIREAGWKLHKVRILGLEEKPAIEKILIGALLRSPPTRMVDTGEAESFKPSQWVISN